MLERDPHAARYQARYRQFWAFPEWRRLQACWPTWCMWDDHEIVHDWGARRAHQQPPWQRVFAGARGAFVDYQVSRTLALSTLWPAAFHHAFVWCAVCDAVERGAEPSCTRSEYHIDKGGRSHLEAGRCPYSISRVPSGSLGRGRSEAPSRWPSRR